MQRIPLLSVFAGAVVLLAAGLGPAMAADAADARAQGETLYLDPETGDVIDPPADRAAAAQDRGAGDDAKPWVNDDGVEMLTPDHDGMADRRAVECPDGSLRMGDFPNEQAARDALCDP